MPIWLLSLFSKLPHISFFTWQTISPHASSFHFYSTTFLNNHDPLCVKRKSNKKIVIKCLVWNVWFLISIYHWKARELYFYINFFKITFTVFFPFLIQKASPDDSHNLLTREKETREWDKRNEGKKIKGKN